MLKKEYSERRDVRPAELSASIRVLLVTDTYHYKRQRFELFTQHTVGECLPWC